MIIAIGSKNPVKVGAVQGILSQHPFFQGAEFQYMEVPSGVGEQPFGDEEIRSGAQNRARAVFEAFPGCKYGIGIESGLVNIAGTGLFDTNVAVCSIYDGNTFFKPGWSPGFPIQSDIARLAREERIQLDTAAKRVGLTSNPRVGYSHGVISIYTQGRWDRKDLLEAAVDMAIIPIINPGFQ